MGFGLPLDPDKIRLALPGEVLARKSASCRPHIPDGPVKDVVVLTADDLQLKPFLSLYDKAVDVITELPSLLQRLIVLL